MIKFLTVYIIINPLGKSRGRNECAIAPKLLEFSTLNAFRNRNRKLYCAFILVYDTNTFTAMLSLLSSYCICDSTIYILLGLFEINRLWLHGVFKRHKSLGKSSASRYRICNYKYLYKTRRNEIMYYFFFVLIG